MEKQRNIIITGIQPWDIEIGSNCKNIAREFAKSNKVLYVNSPLDRISAWKKRRTKNVQKRLKIIDRLEPALREVEKNLWVYNPPIFLLAINWLPSFLFNILNKWNSFRFANSITNAMGELVMDECILFTDSDMFRSLHLKEYLSVEAFIYYSRDNLMTVPYWEKHGVRIEPIIIKKADVVVANSPHLAEMAKKHNVNSYYVGQGCDTEKYRAASFNDIPKDLKKISGPIIGYVGLLTERRLDVEIIERIAIARPTWSVVLVGPQEESFKKCELHKYDNVHFLGAKKPDELPAYVNGFDVCINPQIVNELTKGNYPRKIDEYLAAGKITVATYTPTMEVFRGYCFLAEKPEDYITLIEKGLKENNTKRALKRSHFAASHSWENNALSIWESLESAALKIYKPIKTL